MLPINNISFCILFLQRKLIKDIFKTAIWNNKYTSVSQFSSSDHSTRSYLLTKEFQQVIDHSTETFGGQCNRWRNEHSYFGIPPLPETYLTLLYIWRGRNVSHSVLLTIVCYSSSVLNGVCSLGDMKDIKPVIVVGFEFMWGTSL